MRNDPKRRMAGGLPGLPPPNQVKALVDLYAQRKLPELLRRGKPLARQYPKATIIRNLLGAANAGLGRFPEAIACYHQALETEPNSTEVYNNLGLALGILGKHDEAIASYRRAIEIKPDAVEPHVNLCTILDRLNRVAELEEALRAARRNGLASHPEVLLRSAQFEIRKQNFDKALTLLNSQSTGKLSQNSRRRYFHHAGVACDRLGLFDKAFENFRLQNETTAEALQDMRSRSEAYFDRTVELARSWRSGGRPAWTGTSSVPEETVPAFLVGFPRSGTTLLDTILLGHPKITVVEEQPTLAPVLKRFGRVASIEELNKLSDSDVRKLRAAYLDQLAGYVDGSSKDNLILDKNPLNIRHVGLIHRIFPNAKFVLSLRHPCDCVLSCFMQDFLISEAMFNFLTLERSAQLYAAIMQLWKAYVRSLNPAVFTVKYEDLISDTHSTCKDLIHFLELDWDDKLLDHRQTAESRGWIETPSYHQVMQPLYRQAIGRWKNYRKQLNPVLPLLEPWIEEFGYATKASVTQSPSTYQEYEN